MSTRGISRRMARGGRKSPEQPPGTKQGSKKWNPEVDPQGTRRNPSGPKSIREKTEQERKGQESISGRRPAQGETSQRQSSNPLFRRGALSPFLWGTQKLFKQPAGPNQGSRKLNREADPQGTRRKLAGTYLDRNLAGTVAGTPAADPQGTRRKLAGIHLPGPKSIRKSSRKPAADPQGTRRKLALTEQERKSQKSISGRRSAQLETSKRQRSNPVFRRGALSPFFGGTQKLFKPPAGRS